MEILLISLLTLVSSFVGTLTGFGTSTIMVPVLVLFFPLPQTLLFVGVIHWFGDIWKMSLFKSGLRWKLIFLFGIPGILATYIGARLVFSLPEKLLSQLLGAFLIAYTIFLFVNPKFKFKQNNINAVFGGTLSGFLAGISGVGGAVRGAFLSIFNLPKAVYIATSGSIGLIIDSTRLVTYFSEGTRVPQNLLWGFLIFIPISYVGAEISKRVVDKIPQISFRNVVSVFLFIVGLKLLLFP